MKKIMILGVALATLLASCGNAETESSEAETTKPRELAFEVIDYPAYAKLFDQQDDIVYVVNFWATWCVPCVEELPHFMEVKDEYADNANFRMVLVSLDKASAMETKVKPFMEKRDMKVDMYLLDDVKGMNKWIPEVAPDWSGAIPATLIYKNGKRLAFHEGQLSKEELQELIKQYL